MTPPTLAARPAGGAGLGLGSRITIDSRVHWIGSLLDGILRGSRESENAGYRVPQILPAVSFAIGAPPAPADSLDKIHASAGGAPMLSLKFSRPLNGRVVVTRNGDSCGYLNRETPDWVLYTEKHWRFGREHTLTEAKAMFIKNRFWSECHANGR